MRWDGAVGVRMDAQALCGKTGKAVVLKVYDLTNAQDREWSRLKAYREALIHARLRHESIVLLYCAFQVGRHGHACLAARL